MGSDLVSAVRSALLVDPRVSAVEFVGSRANGTAQPLSDWDFAVECRNFEALADDLPALVQPLEPLAAQWDPLGTVRTFMLMLGGPAKVDLIFDVPQEEGPPWVATEETRPKIAVVARSYVDEARRRVGPKRARIRPIIERLLAEHADAAIALRFRNDLELLVSVMLSAQTTDVNVNRVTERLFEKYRRPEDYLAVSEEELQRDIFATGFYRQKAKALRGTMRVLREEFDGRVPRRLEDLLRLPGVARKTANVVSAELGDAQGIVVDTHVRRLSQRLGLTKQDDPVKIERDLQRLVPRERWAIFPHLLIWHGRRVCIARAPRCEACVVNDLCPSARVNSVS
jgi:endonuclease-3